MLLGNQALTLSPFCFSLKCPIWGWGLGAERRERAVQLQAHLVLQSVHYPIPEQPGLPSTQETAARTLPQGHSPVSHPSPSTPHLAYPIPGNLQMQTEEGLSSLVPSDLLLSVWGDLCPELVKGYGVCWF